MTKETVILLVCIAAIVLLVAIISVVWLLTKKKDKRIKIDDAFINELLSYLGGKDNIDKIDVENSRLKFLVKNLDICNFDGLKTLSTQGVFVSGLNIKMLFKYDSLNIKNAIEKIK